MKDQKIKTLVSMAFFTAVTFLGNSGISNSGSSCGRDAVYSFWTCICSDGDASPGRKKRRGHRDGWFADL